MNVDKQVQQWPQECSFWTKADCNLDVISVKPSPLRVMTTCRQGSQSRPASQQRTAFSRTPSTIAAPSESGRAAAKWRTVGREESALVRGPRHPHPRWSEPSVRVLLAVGRTLPDRTWHSVKPWAEESGGLGLNVPWCNKVMDRATWGKCRRD